LPENFSDGGIIKYDWTPYLGPVIDQGDCANCWAESMIQVFNGIVNKYVPKNVRKFYGNNDGMILLSSEQLTECTQVSFLRKTGHRPPVSDFDALYGCQGGSWNTAINRMSQWKGSPLISNGLNTIENYSKNARYGKL
jgi:hypothetical protein